MLQLPSEQLILRAVVDWTAIQDQLPKVGCQPEQFGSSIPQRIAWEIDFERLCEDRLNKLNEIARPNTAWGSLELLQLNISREEFEEAALIKHTVQLEFDGMVICKLNLAELRSQLV